jgi:hypothetical protein
MTPLDLVTFDTTGLEAQGDRENVRVWYSGAGDGVGLHYFPIPPDIDADLENVESVRAFYRNSATQSGLAIIEVEVPTIQGCRCVRTMIKVPQKPHGMTYLGSLTLPFRDFSYVLKVACSEQGVTGVRDAVVFEKCIKDGTVSVSRKGRIDGWMADPYDATVYAPLMRNRAEAQEYDSQFPQHPLSRARQVLDRIQATVTLATELRASLAFRYLAMASRAKPWWRLR